MNLCFIADARSPIARNWIGYFLQGKHDVTVISTYAYYLDDLNGVRFRVIPVAFSRFAKHGDHGKGDPRIQSLSTWKQVPVRRFLPLAFRLRAWIAPFNLCFQARAVRHFMQEVNPDLVHAMRIPFEGMLAAAALQGSRMPLLVSVWGNDFTLFASRFPLMAWRTRQTMARTNGLHADTLRDIRLARQWGFSSGKPSITLPGAGGIRSEYFHPGLPDSEMIHSLGILKPDKVVIYPRRLRPGSVCTQQFFESIPLILREQPNTLFICPGLEGNSTVNRWISRLGIQKAVRLLPELHHVQMANLFRLAQVTVSPSIHDGTPNTLLEAMACGCFPVAGDIESLREWITDNENGLLCDPTNPEALAEAIIRGLEDVELQAKARKHNLRLIGARADYDKVMARAEKFYQQVIDATTTSIESAKRYMPS